MIWRPDWIVLENVKGIVETEGGRFLLEIVSSLEGAGYRVNCKLLNAVDYGVPQRRNRIFIVGSRRNVAYEFPIPVKEQIVATVDDAIKDLPPLTNGANVDVLPYGSEPPSPYAQSLRSSRRLVSGNLVTRNAPHIVDRYGYISPGGNWEQIPEQLLTNYTNVEGCHTGIYRRLDPSLPSVVIGNYRKNMLIHPWQDRGLSVREAARLQSIPDDFEFTGSIGFQQQQVGNMVPPRLGEAVFRSIKK